MQWLLRMTFFRTWLDNRLGVRSGIDLTEGIASRSRMAGAAEEVILARQAFPREKPEKIHQPVPERFSSCSPTGGSRVALRTNGIHSSPLEVRWQPSA